MYVISVLFRGSDLQLTPKDRPCQPVCAVTGNARDAQLAECLAAGFSDTVTKPYNFADIMAKITTLAPPRGLVFSPA